METIDNTFEIAGATNNAIDNDGISSKQQKLLQKYFKHAKLGHPSLTEDTESYFQRLLKIDNGQHPDRALVAVAAVIAESQWAQINRPRLSSLAFNIRKGNASKEINKAVENGATWIVKQQGWKSWKKRFAWWYTIPRSFYTETEARNLIISLIERYCRKKETLLRYRTPPFSAVISGEGTATPTELTVVCFSRLDGMLGIGLRKQNEECSELLLDFIMDSPPNDLITLWRAATLLRQLPFINQQSISGAFHLVQRKLLWADVENNSFLFQRIGGQPRINEIMHADVPEEIIDTILESQTSMNPLNLDAIAFELERKTIAWRAEFAEYCIQKPKEIVMY